MTHRIIVLMMLALTLGLALLYVSRLPAEAGVPAEPSLPALQLEPSPTTPRAGERLYDARELRSLA